jgi:methionine-rich copper-binding protein CopC
VQGLLDLANDVLAGHTLTPTPPSLVDITKALGAINDGFDECRVILNWYHVEPSAAKRSNERSMEIAKVKEPEIAIYPNPFTTTTHIEIHVDEETDVKVELFNLEGKRLHVLVDEQATPESPVVVTYNSNALAAGTYIYRFTTANGHVAHGKLSVIR